VLPHALAPFGKVSSFEWRGQGYDDRKADWVGRRDAMNQAMLHAFEQAHREAPVDAFVGYVSGHTVSPETLHAIAKSGAVLFNFCWDDKVRFPGKKVGGRYRSTAAVASAIDLNLTNAPESIVKYAVHGGLAMFFAEAAHPEIHCPKSVPFDLDVSFIGANYGWRPQFIRSLERLGVKVECFGRDWPNGPLDEDEVIRLYSRSRINLGFATVGHSRTLMCLKGRDFEVPMSGGLYLTQHNPELGLVFDIGTELVTYRDEHECVQKIRWLLANPDKADAIRRAGRARALRDHTYEARWSKVFELAGLLQSS
jgi:spore maturation protein CgeB